MRLFRYCLLLATSSLLAAQTSGELHSRCGEPDRERFAARPGVALTVQYGSDGLACQVLLESPQPLLNDEKNLSMSSDVVTEILEKVVPLTSRGNEIGSMLTPSGPHQVRFTDYLNLSIMRATHNCLQLKPDCELRATVAFKRDACQGQRPAEARSSTRR
jgi:hypothetical protein